MDGAVEFSTDSRRLAKLLILVVGSCRRKLGNVAGHVFCAKSSDPEIDFSWRAPRQGRAKPRCTARERLLARALTKRHGRHDEGAEVQRYLVCCWILLAGSSLHIASAFWPKSASAICVIWCQGMSSNRSSATSFVLRLSDLWRRAAHTSIATHTEQDHGNWRNFPLRAHHGSPWFPLGWPSQG